MSQGQGDPRRAGALPQGVQARAAAGHAAPADLHPRGGHRHHPQRSRGVPHPGGQLPLPERGVVRVGESQPPAPRVPRVLHALSGPLDPRLSAPAPGHAAVVGVAVQRESGGGGAHARHPQLRLLRALVPRPRDGCVPGGGARPHRRGQLPLHAHHRRPPAGGRHLPPGGRGLPRSADVPAHQPARRAGAHERVSRGQRGHRQRARRRGGRRQGRVRLHADAHQVLPRPGAAAGPGADLRRPAQGRLRVHAGEPGLAGGEDHRRLRRLQHADGPLRHPQGDRRLRELS